MGAPVNNNPAAGAFTNGATANNDPIKSQNDAQNEALRMTAEMNASTARFQAAMSALKAVSEALNAGNDARNKAIEKTGAAGR